jgi:hypothetical protein
MQDYHWQLEKENAVAATNLERAKELRALQDKERDGLATLISRLLADREPGEQAR